MPGVTKPPAVGAVLDRVQKVCFALPCCRGWHDLECTPVAAIETNDAQKLVARWRTSPPRDSEHRFHHQIGARNCEGFQPAQDSRLFTDSTGFDGQASSAESDKRPNEISETSSPRRARGWRCQGYAGSHSTRLRAPPAAPSVPQAVERAGPGMQVNLLAPMQRSQAIVKLTDAQRWRNGACLAKQLRQRAVAECATILALLQERQGVAEPEIRGGRRRRDGLSYTFHGSFRGQRSLRWNQRVVG